MTVSRRLDCPHVQGTAPTGPASCSVLFLLLKRRSPRPSLTCSGTELPNWGQFESRQQPKMLVTINLVVIFVSSSLGLPLSQDKPMSTTSQKLAVTSQILSAVSQKMPTISQKLPATLMKLPTTSPLLAVAKKIKQSLLVKEIVKLSKEQSIGMTEPVKIKITLNTRKENKAKTLSRVPRRRRRMSRRRRIPICMSRCLSLGMLHPAQCHSLCS